MVSQIPINNDAFGISPMIISDIIDGNEKNDLYIFHFHFFEISDFFFSFFLYFNLVLYTFLNFLVIFFVFILFSKSYLISDIFKKI